MPNALWYVASEIRGYASDTLNNLELAHLCTAALNGEQWAADRIVAALKAIDTTRPDGAIARGTVTP